MDINKYDDSYGYNHFYSNVNNNIITISLIILTVVFTIGWTWSGQDGMSKIDAQTLRCSRLKAWLINALH